MTELMRFCYNCLHDDDEFEDAKSDSLARGLGEALDVSMRLRPERAFDHLLAMPQGVTTMQGAYRNSTCAIIMALAISSVSPPIAVARCSGEQSKTSSSEWKEKARLAGLKTEEMAQLEKQKLVLTSTCFKQVFTPYNESPVPVFITSDSIVNVFNLMLEDSLFSYEMDVARNFPSELRKIYLAVSDVKLTISAPPELHARAKRRAEIMIGVAVGLLDDQFVPKSADVASEVKGECKRIVDARDQRKPDWLGKPDAGFLAIDYTQFRPRGFYVKLDRLQRYFRAVKWLSAIPFRVQNDEELLAFAYIVKGFAQAPTPENRRSPYFGDPWRFNLADDTWHDIKTISGLRESLSKKLEPDRINDLVTAVGGKFDSTTQPNARVISPQWSIDAELFHATMKGATLPSLMPNPLEVAALFHSPFAESSLSKPRPPETQKAIDAFRREHLYCLTNDSYYEPDELMTRYLLCLASLFDDKDPDLPSLFKSDIWRRKSCHTFLGGWAQAKSALQLHFKEASYASFGTEDPTGFVEPFPEFFSKLGDLALVARRTYAAENSMTSKDRLEIFAEQCHWLADQQEQLAKTPSADISQAVQRLRKMEFGFPSAWHVYVLSEPKVRAVYRLENSNQVLTHVQALRDVAREITQGRPNKTIVAFFDDDKRRCDPPDWAGLSVICHQLASICHKQLRNVPLNGREQRIIKGYGRALAELVGYIGTERLWPRDDAPRCVTVYTETISRNKLHVAVGRPREMYLLYPNQGKEVLCRGAVMPYYETVRSDRLTNQEWQSLLDSADPPKPPQWALPLYTPHAELSTKVKEQKGE